ncbi:MAG: recombinase RecT [Gemmatimonadota bacterium]
MTSHQMITVDERRIGNLNNLQWILKTNEDVRADIEGALMGLVSVETFLAQCVIAATSQPEVLDCGPQQMLSAILRCAQLGLMPGPLEHVALVPHKGKIVVRPQWQGLKALMERHPDVAEVTAVLVHVSDTFRIVNGRVEHEYDPLGPERVFIHPSDRNGKPPGLKGGYVTIRYADGSLGNPPHGFIRESEIEKRRLCSEVPDLYQRGGAGPWRKWYEEMSIKTVIRHAFARRAVPIDPASTQHFVNAEALDRAREPQAPVEAIGWSSPAPAEPVPDPAVERSMARAKAFVARPPPSILPTQEPAYPTPDGLRRYVEAEGVDPEQVTDLLAGFEANSFEDVTSTAWPSVCQAVYALRMAQ